MTLPIYRLSITYLVFLIFYNNSFGQIKYNLQYIDSTSSEVTIEIELPEPVLSQSLSFVMPRCVPGSYNIILYDRFVQNVTAVGTKSNPIKMQKNSLDAPRWNIADSDIQIKSIRYAVDLAAMEKGIAALSDFSVLRKNYIGMLNYSIFGWIDGTEEKNVSCTVQTFKNWEIYSTLSPKENPDKESYTFNAINYYELADGQTLLGAFRVKKFN
ncbi:MAG: hypothetical protein ABJA79_11460, partial [Parafilimonas sp.]